MKKIVCIFAHPDDEVFGPGGTIAILAKEAEVTVICVTNGDAGLKSVEDERELSEIRSEELRRSTKVLGVKKVIFLGYKDGMLSNSLYHEIAEKIKQIVEEIHPDTLLTYEPRGVSGHLDHIAVSMITSFVFEQLDFITTLYLYCLTEQARRAQGAYFIHFPPGYKKEDIDKVVDITPVWDLKVNAMHEHKSQMHDVKRILDRFKQLPKEEAFLIRKKS